MGCGCSGRDLAKVPAKRYLSTAGGFFVFRRIVCCLMLPCLLLTQSATFGHVHTQGQPAGHDLLRHIHTGKPAVERGHHHGSDRHHHHHDDVDQEATKSGTHTSDHDSDAVYLSPVDFHFARSQSVDDVRSVSGELATETIPSLQLGAIERYPLLRPPSEVHSNLRPIYIRHLTLLI